MSLNYLSVASGHSTLRQLTHTSTVKPWRNQRQVIIWSRRQSTRVPAATTAAVKAPPLIYVLGSSNDARFCATALDAGPAQGLVKLLIDSEMRFQMFLNAGAKIEVQDNDQRVAASFLGAELVRPFRGREDFYHLPLDAVVVPQHSANPNVEHRPKPSFQEEERLFYGTRDLRKPVRFSGDSLTLNYGEEQRMQIGGSTPVSEAELDNLRRMVNEKNADNSIQFSEAQLRNFEGLDPELESCPIQKSDAPIENLVAASPSIEIFDRIKEIKHRLSRTSTILIPLKGGGLIDKLNQEIFPDPVTRPTYLPAILVHSLWANQRHFIGVSSTGQEIEKKVLNNLTSDLSNSFDVNHIPGRLLMSKPIRFSEESLADHIWRERRSEYLIKAFKGSPLAGVELLKQSSLRTMQVKSLVVFSIVHSLTVQYGCSNGGILLNKERWNDVQDLCREAAQVFQIENHRLSAKIFEEDVVKYVRGGIYNINRTFYSALPRTRHWY